MSHVSRVQSVPSLVHLALGDASSNAAEVDGVGAALLSKTMKHAFQTPTFGLDPFVDSRRFPSPAFVDGKPLSFHRYCMRYERAQFPFYVVDVKWGGGAWAL
ncbi:hypothetical protein PI125_g26589 [Phytophthora idaei]|nr:hypothetical protein PI125_g26589 [Phytophthora idaei]